MEPATELLPNEFQCVHCGGIFTKGWTEQEAIEEQRRNFNEEPREDDVRVCDNCYQLLVATMFD